MTVIVTDNGFEADDWTDGFVRWEDVNAAPSENAALDLPNTVFLADIETQVRDFPMIRIAFPSSADGRGFTLAAQLRQTGYTGRLRAVGHVLADQYAMARRSGFDEVEIDDTLAARQPEEQWVFRANWTAHDYQSKLRATA
ncbi:MAG: DUF934 domain-containing protein [Pseudomonadota bacterium]